MITEQSIINGCGTQLLGHTMSYHYEHTWEVWEGVGRNVKIQLENEAGKTIFTVVIFYSLKWDSICKYISILTVLYYLIAPVKNGVKTPRSSKLKGQ